MAEQLVLQFDKHGDPTKVLSLVRVPLAPVPAKHVRVRVAARAVNPADVLFVEGLYDRQIGDQIVSGFSQPGGSECAGVVSALGEGATKFRVGQRLYVNTGFPRTRAWSEFVDVPEEGGVAVPLPDAVSFEHGCQLLVNPLTALGFLDTLIADGLVADDCFLLTAANSALCKFVLQLARLRNLPFRAICVVRSPSVRAELLALGAFAVIATDETADVEAAIRAAAPSGLKAAFDALGGGPVVRAVARCLANRARVYVYGRLVESPMEIDAIDMLFRNTGVAGWYLGFYLGAKKPAEIGALFGEILGHMATGKLRVSAKVFDFATQSREAIVYTVAGSKEGKTVLVSKV